MVQHVFADASHDRPPDGTESATSGYDKRGFIFFCDFANDFTRTTIDALNFTTNLNNTITSDYVVIVTLISLRVPQIHKYMTVVGIVFHS